jgi:starch phosphorylase
MFGHTYDELRHLRQRGYDPAAIYETNDELKPVLDMIRTGYFSPEQPDLFVPIFDALVRHGDHYMLLADYNAYVLCEDRVDVAFRDPQRWTRMAILNVAGAGRFSIDRLVREYAAAVWEAEPVRNAQVGEVTV